MNSDEYTLEEKKIEVGDGHTIYTQLWGNKNAEKTVLFLHGGPGSGCNDGHKNQFDPTQHRVLFHDQRGSGLSTPAGELSHNNTDALVSDIVKIAKEYDISSFVVTGGSWGSTLALVLAIRHPELVESLLVRGIFTGRKQEIDYLDKGGVQTFFPDAWEEFVESAPAEHASDPGAFHGPRILGDDQAEAKQSAYAYDSLEGGVMRLDDRRSKEDYETYDKNGITVEYQYLENACFLEEGYILDNASSLAMPVHIVQGRYDAVCPPITAWELHKAVPHSKLHWTTAGHSGGDRSTWEVTKALLSVLA